jgi:hypothetical protein
MALQAGQPTPQPTILIIAGMHRSGTSLTASLLQQAGLDVGASLVGSAKGNPKGHFENVEFMEFHRSVLHAQGIDPSGWTVQTPLALTEAQVQTAKTIVSRNATQALWGWKDPRTTLFLDAWATLLPEANFLLMVRAPWEVADSLFRRRLREDAVFATRPEFAIEVWQHYNQQVLNFWQQHRDRCLLATVTRMTQQPDAVFTQLRQKFGLNLAPPQAEIYDRALLNQMAATDHRAGLVQLCFPDAMALYHQLLIQEAESYAAIAPRSGDDLSPPSTAQITAGVFQNWYRLRCLDDQLGESQSQITTLRSQLAQAQAQSAQMQQKLHATQAHYHDAMAQLDKAHAFLTQRSDTIAALTQQIQHTEQALQQAESLFEQSHHELQEAQTQLEQANTQITAMEASKFWKVRQAWFRFRNRLGFSE